MKTTCPLCGLAYEPGDSTCRASGCPLASSSCQKLHCPRCGYSVPDERASALARWVRRLFGQPGRGQPRAADDAWRLTDVPAGTRGAVARLEAAPAISAQLAAQGVVPGTVLRLTQRAPTFVVEVGETVLAFERAVAQTVWIRPGDACRAAEDDRGAQAGEADQSAAAGDTAAG